MPITLNPWKKIETPQKRINAEEEARLYQRKSKIAVAFLVISVLVWIFLETDAQTEFLNLKGKINTISNLQLQDFAHLIHTFALWSTRVVVFMACGVAAFGYAYLQASEKRSWGSVIARMAIIVAWAILELDNQLNFLKISDHLQKISHPFANKVAHWGYNTALWGARAAPVVILISEIIRRTVDPEELENVGQVKS